MKRYGMYFLMQLRRAAKILPAVLCVNLVLCALAGAAIGTLSGRNTADDAKKRLRIGISGDAGETYLGFGINAVSKIDSSRYYVEFAQLDEKDAASELDAGRLSAYVVIPDGFVDAVSHGEIMTVKYVTSPSESGIAAMLREEILDAVTVMLRESQLGVYGAADVLRDTDPERSLGEVYDKVFVEYADYILSRGKICAVETADSAVSVSLPKYMICALALFSVCLVSMAASPLFAKDKTDISAFLMSKWHGAAPIVLSEALAYTLLIAAVSAVTFGAAAAAFTAVPQKLGISLGIEAAEIFSFAARLPLCIASFAFCQFLIYEVSDGISGGVAAQFFCAAAGAYFGGLIYPISFFPDAMQSLSHYIPTGAAREFLLHGTAGGMRPVFVILIWGLSALCVSVLLRRRRIRLGGTLWRRGR